MNAPTRHRNDELDAPASSRCLRRGGLACAAVLLTGWLAGLLSAPAAAATTRHHVRAAHPALSADGDTLVWRPVRHASRYLLSAVTPTRGRQHIMRSALHVVTATHAHVAGPAGETVTYRVRAARRGSSWTNPVTIHFPGASQPPSAGGAPTITLSGHTISWSAASSQLEGAISTAPRGSAGRQTSYLPLVAGGAWSPQPQPGRTLYYGVEVNGTWSANEIEISWPSGSSSGSSTATGTAPGTSPAPGPPGGSTAPGSPGGSTTVSGLGSTMLVGLNETGWGQSAAADVASTFKIDRMDVAWHESASDFWTRGTAVDMLFSGPYTSGGVSAINATSWAQNALDTFHSQCADSATNCPAIEVLNEPYGSWFWGPNATSPANEAAYAHLLQTTSNLFHSRYGAASPQILAAFGSDSWWAGIKAAVPNIDDYVDGVTVHAYGGTGSAAVSALGGRALVTDAYQTTGKPIWVTEFGWPTAVGQPATGDSLQWSPSAQAANTYDFVNWLRSTGYVAAAMDFNYRDYGTNMWYGVESTSGVKKPAWTALAEAADQQACTVCS